MDCLRCGRLLRNPESIRAGYGPACAKKSGIDIKSDPDDLLLETIRQPFSGDVVLRRDGNDKTGLGRANIPHSVIWHSPDGFNWGYGGSGSADLALNILNAFVPPGTDGEPPRRCYRGECSATAGDLHQQFKNDFLTAMPIGGGIISADTIKNWIASKVVEVMV